MDSGGAATLNIGGGENGWESTLVRMETSLRIRLQCGEHAARFAVRPQGWRWRGQYEGSTSNNAVACSSADVSLVKAHPAEAVLRAPNHACRMAEDDADRPRHGRVPLCRMGPEW